MLDSHVIISAKLLALVLSVVTIGASAQTSARFNTLAYYPGTQIDWEEAGVSLRVPQNSVGLWQP